MRNILFVFILTVLSLQGISATITSAASGNWNSAATWNPAQVPVAGDVVRLDYRYTVTVDGANAACTSISLYSNCGLCFSSAASGLKINSGFTLTVFGAANLTTQNGSNLHTLTVDGILSVNGALTLGSGSSAVTVVNNGAITAASLAVSGGNAISVTGTGSYAFAGLASFAGSLTFVNNSTFTAGSFSTSGSSQMNFSGTGTIAVSGAMTIAGKTSFVNNTDIACGSLTTSGSNLVSFSGSGNYSCTGAVNLGGNYTLVLPGVLTGTTGTFQPTANLDISGGGKILLTGTTSFTSNSAALTLNLSKVTTGDLTLTVPGNYDLILNVDSLVTTGTFTCNADFASDALINVNYLAVTGNFTSNNSSNPGINDFTVGKLIVGGDVLLSSTWPGAQNRITLSNISTVTGNVSLVNTDNNSSGFQNTIQVNSSLTIAGTTGITLTYNNTSFNSYGPQNTFVVGSSLASGNVSVTSGDLNMSAIISNTFVGRNDSANVVWIQNGSFLLGDSVKVSTTCDASNNMILINDNSPYDQKSKSVYFGGSVNNVAQGKMKIADSNGNASYQTYFNGVKKQTIPASDQWNFYRMEVTNTSDTVYFGGNLSRAGNRLLGKMTVNTGAVLNDNGYSFGGTGNDSISLVTNGTFVISNLTDQFPLNIESVSAQDNSVVYFLNNSGSTQSVLGGTSSIKNFATVRAGGTGVKQVVASLSSVNIGIQSLDVVAGTLTFGAGSTTLNTISGGQATTQMVSVQNGATLQFPRDFSTDPQSKFTFGYTSNLNYNGAAQKIYRMHSSVVGSGELAAIGNLVLGGSSNKTINAGDSVKLARKLSITSTVLVISSGSFLTLLSDASNTAWIGTITSSSISYLGSGLTKGKIIAQRYVSLADANYRDFSSPVKLATLENWKNAGMLLTGFTGSQYPTSSFVNAYKYNEATDGILNTGFVKSTNVTDLVHTFDGSAISQGGWRIYQGYNAQTTNLTLKDSGEVYAGDVTFKIGFTHGAADRIVDDGWNFIGNPYPSALDWSLVYADNVSVRLDSLTDGISPSMYVYMPTVRNNPGGALNYGAFNAATGIKIGFSNAVLSSFQGFWVKALHTSAPSTNYTLTIKESHKSDGAGTFLKSNKTADPEMLFIDLIDPSNRKDQVGMHFWPNATIGYDFVWDIAKFGSEPNVPSIQIVTDNNEFLWVNALPESLVNYKIKLLVNVVKSGDHKLNWAGKRDLLSAFSCVTLLDLETGITTDMKASNEYSFDGIAGYNQTRFVITAIRSIPIAEAVISDASCFGYANGSVQMDLRSWKDSLDFSLFKVGSPEILIKRYVGTSLYIKEQIAVGIYNLVNNNAQTGCGVKNYVFEVNQPEEVKAKFKEITRLVTPGQDVYFENNSSGSSNYTWSFSDDLSTSNEESPTHKFLLPGTYTIELVASNDDLHCTSTFASRITVAYSATTGINTTSDIEGVFVSSHEQGIFINNHGKKTIVLTVLTIDGKLVAQETIEPGIRILPITVAGTYLVNGLSGEEQFTTKIVKP